MPPRPTADESSEHFHRKFTYEFLVRCWQQYPDHAELLVHLCHAYVLYTRSCTHMEHRGLRISYPCPPAGLQDSIRDIEPLMLVTIPTEVLVRVMDCHPSLVRHFCTASPHPYAMFFERKEGEYERVVVYAGFDAFYTFPGRHEAVDFIKDHWLEPPPVNECDFVQHGMDYGHRSVRGSIRVFNPDGCDQREGIRRAWNWIEAQVDCVFEEGNVYESSLEMSEEEQIWYDEDSFNYGASE